MNWKTLIKIFKNIDYFLAILLLTILVIIIKNFEPNTYLSGWDTLHPEFDFGLNFQRLIAGVWRQEQGLGAIAGHSHMSDLPRVVFMWILHFIMPMNLLRYSYIFFCLAVGPIGIYYIVIYLTQKEKYTKFVALISSLLYLLNISTVQQFYVPFEMFPTQYAFLPWIMLFTLKFLQEGKKKNIVLFSLFTLIATPQSYAAHLWYPFFGVYCLFLGLYYALNRFSIPIFKKAVTLFLLTIVINAFWLLPNLYYIKTSSYIPKESKQNRIFSQEFRLRNRETGYLQDVALIKGFYFNWNAFDFKSGKSVSLMPEWQNHLQKPYVSLIGYTIFGLAILGIGLSLQKKNRLFSTFLPFFILPFIFLMNGTPPFKQFFDYLLNFSIFEEALRFVFSKLSILLIFSYVIFFALFFQVVIANLTKKVVVISSIAIFFLLVVYIYPAFQGNLISAKMKISIPKDYFEFWSYMKNQKDGVVLSLPIHTFAGWQYYDFDYQGAGFIWFGLKQPILERDFDRWSIANEQAFRELQYTLYSRDSNQFLTHLKKFNVSYILWDRHIISTESSNQQQILFTREIQQIIDDLIQKGNLVKNKSFGKLALYEVVPQGSELTTLQNPINVVPSYRWNWYDSAYEQYGTYITDNNDHSNNIYYPLRDLVTQTDRVKPESIKFDNLVNKFTIQTFPDQTHDSVLIPNYLQTEKQILSALYITQNNVSRETLLTFEPFLPVQFSSSLSFKTYIEPSATPLSINGLLFNITALEDRKKTYIGDVYISTISKNFVNGQEIKLSIPISGRSSVKPGNENYQLIAKPTHYNASDIIEKYRNQSGISLDPLGKRIKLEATNDNKTIVLEFPNLDHTIGYLLTFTTQNEKGLPLRICLKNNATHLCNLYDELHKNKELQTDYFLIPPIDTYFGYSLHISNVSYGNFETINSIEDISITPIQYNFLSKLYYYNSRSVFNSTINNIVSFNDSSYRKIISAADISDQTEIIFLSQSFHPGWKAYRINSQFTIFNLRLHNMFPMFFGTELKDHVLVNNWANGFLLRPEDCRASEGQGQRNSSCHIVILFWPQYLEYIGFGFIIVGLIFVIKYDREKGN